MPIYIIVFTLNFATCCHVCDMQYIIQIPVKAIGDVRKNI